MSGIQDFNYPAFVAAARDLRAQGFEVLNPAEQFEGDQSLPRSVYLRRAVENLLQCEAIVMLPDWQRSPGAIFEMTVASALELSIHRYVAHMPPASLL